jgi:2-polyprenyl-3-methyl-5-hydroxy-6-metoxy-1,4-benzoquinol methylase
MDESVLTERQKREREFYREFSRRAAPEEVSFDPILTKERRPWNAYWFVYELVQKRFTAKGQRLLDLGCGPGEASVVCARVGYDVYGFDICTDNIAIAEKLARKHGLADQIHFSVQAAENLDYPNEYFDLVLGIDILHHVEIDRAVRECLRVLKPGGIAVFKEWVEAPVFDRIRKTALFRLLFPRGKSLSRHITEDERKLTAGDLRLIGSICPKMSVRRFMCLSRLNRFFRSPSSTKPSLLEKADMRLFQAVPCLGRFGGSAVLRLEK